MERGLGFRRILMSDVQVRAAVKAQKAAAKKNILTYRGVQYIRNTWESRWAPLPTRGN